MRKLICKIFGHIWVEFPLVGRETRICKTCLKVQRRRDIVIMEPGCTGTSFIWEEEK